MLELVPEPGDISPPIVPTPAIPPVGARCTCGRRLIFWAVRDGIYVCGHCSGSLRGVR